MIACSVVRELSILLEDEEVSRLVNNKLIGKIKVRDRDGIVGDRELEIKVGETDKYQVFVEIKTIPKGVYVDKVELYEIILSKEGYHDLRKKDI
jgi:hypothetical protein